MEIGVEPSPLEQVAEDGLGVSDVITDSVAGLVTNSIIFCCLLTIKDRCKKSAFSTNTQSRFASVVVDGVLGLCA